MTKVLCLQIKANVNNKQLSSELQKVAMAKVIQRINSTNALKGSDFYQLIMSAKQAALEEVSSG